MNPSSISFVGGLTFEHKLKLKIATASAYGRTQTNLFTESLILAQDERWRRA